MLILALAAIGLLGADLAAWRHGAPRGSLRSVSSPRPEGVDRLVARAAARQAELAALVEGRKRRAGRAADVLAQTYGATRVVLFGSLARGSAHERSDVDLAVWGLSHEQVSVALDEVTAILGAPVDLVCMESAPRSLALRVANDGVELVSRV